MHLDNCNYERLFIYVILNFFDIRMRKTCHENGMEMIKEGKEREAFLHFSKGTTVTQAMKTKLILALKKAEIPYVVSPYEGDAQLAYMAREKMIDVVISDDSDCLPYGIRTILFKLDMDGSVEEIKRKNLGANQALRFVDWNDDMVSGSYTCCFSEHDEYNSFCFFVYSQDVIIVLLSLELDS